MGIMGSLEALAARFSARAGRHLATTPHLRGLRGFVGGSLSVRAECGYQWVHGAISAVLLMQDA